MAQSIKSIELVAEKRQVFGKKVKNLRKQGIIPANIYGEEFKSTAISIKLVDFLKTYRQLGDTKVINIKLGKDDIPVLIHQIQKHPITEYIIHIDFRKVNLAKKVQTEISVKTIGESAVIKSNQGVLLVLSDTLLIEALPNNIPAHIEVDISNLQIDQELQVKDIKITGDYIFIDDQDKPVVRITAHKEESVEVETQAPETEVEAEAGKEEVEPTKSTDETKQDKEAKKQESTPKIKEEAEKSQSTKPASEEKK